MRDTTRFAHEKWAEGRVSSERVTRRGLTRKQQRMFDTLSRLCVDLKMKVVQVAPLTHACAHVTEKGALASGRDRTCALFARWRVTADGLGDKHAMHACDRHVVDVVHCQANIRHEVYPSAGFPMPETKVTP